MIRNILTKGKKKNLKYGLSLTKMDDVIVCFSFDFWCRIVKGKIFYKFLEEPLMVISRLCQLMKI